LLQQHLRRLHADYSLANSVFISLVLASAIFGFAGSPNRESALTRSQASAVRRLMNSSALSKNP